MNEVIKTRGHTFEISANGDWGGDDLQGNALRQKKAIQEVVLVIIKLKLSQLVQLHDALLDEQHLEPSVLAGERGMRPDSGADRAICAPIVSSVADPPKEPSAIGASLHIYAHARVPAPEE